MMRNTVFVSLLLVTAQALRISHPGQNEAEPEALDVQKQSSGKTPSESLEPGTFNPEVLEEKVSALFKMLDQDDSEILDCDEVTNATQDVQDEVRKLKAVVDWGLLCGQLDTDGDGEVLIEEFVDGIAGQAAPMLSSIENRVHRDQPHGTADTETEKALESDKAAEEELSTGTVDLDEASLNQIFNEMDTDANGKINCDKVVHDVRVFFQCSKRRIQNTLVCGVIVDLCSKMDSSGFVHLVHREIERAEVEKFLKEQAQLPPGVVLDNDSNAPRPGHQTIFLPENNVVQENDVKACDACAAWHSDKRNTEHSECKPDDKVCHCWSRDIKTLPPDGGIGFCGKVSKEKRHRFCWIPVLLPHDGPLGLPDVQCSRADSSQCWNVCKYEKGAAK